MSRTYNTAPQWVKNLWANDFRPKKHYRKHTPILMYPELDGSWEDITDIKIFCKNDLSFDEINREHIDRHNMRTLLHNYCRAYNPLLLEPYDI